MVPCWKTGANDLWASCHPHAPSPWVSVFLFLLASFIQNPSGFAPLKSSAKSLLSLLMKQIGEQALFICFLQQAFVIVSFIFLFIIKWKFWLFQQCSLQSGHWYTSSSVVWCKPEEKPEQASYDILKVKLKVIDNSFITDRVKNAWHVTDGDPLSNSDIYMRYIMIWAVFAYCNIALAQEASHVTDLACIYLPRHVQPCHVLAH